MGYTILSVAYPLTEVGLDAAGGSEQMLTVLDRALTQAGHRSLVLAAEGSEVFGTHIPSPKARGRLDDQVRRWGQQAHQQLIRETLERYPVDLIHMHSLDFHTYLPGGSVPVLSTLHLPPDWYPRRIFHLRRANYHLNCVSSSQQRGCPPSRHLLPVVPNGIEVDRFLTKVNKSDYVMALGRICPEKGFHFALEAARKARTEMVLAGEVFPYESHLDYFRKEIKPRLDDRRRFVGPVGLSRKRRLLAQAKCLLVPSTVAETSSLVTMEALASGTPVIAYPFGALPEIIEHGRTGFLVQDVASMAEAIRNVSRLDPEACRDAARTRFSAAEMTRRYLSVYRDIIEAARQEAYVPRARAGASWLVAW